MKDRRFGRLMVVYYDHVARRGIVAFESGKVS